MPALYRKPSIPSRASSIPRPHAAPLLSRDVFRIRGATHESVHCRFGIFAECHIDALNIDDDGNGCTRLEFPWPSHFVALLREQDPSHAATVVQDAIATIIAPSIYQKVPIGVDDKASLDEWRRVWLTSWVPSWSHLCDQATSYVRTHGAHPETRRQITALARELFVHGHFAGQDLTDVLIDTGMLPKPPPPPDHWLLWQNALAQEARARMERTKDYARTHPVSDEDDRPRRPGQQRQFPHLGVVRYFARVGASGASA
jgi:hypothetical protein